MAITVVLKPASNAALYSWFNVPKAKNWSYLPENSSEPKYLLVRESDKGVVYGYFRMEDVAGWFVPDE